MIAGGLAILLSGCHPVVPPRPDVADPAGVLARATSEAPSGPVYAPFSAVIGAKGQKITASGMLVVSPPDRFRVELRGPIGPPQLIVTCNGTDLHAWVAGKNTYYSGSLADSSLDGLLGLGGEHVEAGAAAVRLLLGRLPEIPGTPTLSARGPVAAAAWASNGLGSLELGLDGATAHLVQARATNAAGTVVFSAAWEPGAAYPSALTAQLPTLEASADLRFGEWAAATPPDAAFDLPAPEGSVLAPLRLTSDVPPSPAAAPQP